MGTVYVAYTHTYTKGIRPKSKITDLTAIIMQWRTLLAVIHIFHLASILLFFFNHHSFTYLGLAQNQSHKGKYIVHTLTKILGLRHILAVCMPQPLWHICCSYVPEANLHGKFCICHIYAAIHCSICATKAMACIPPVTAAHMPQLCARSSFALLS